MAFMRPSATAEPTSRRGLIRLSGFVEGSSHLSHPPSHLLGPGDREMRSDGKLTFSLSLVPCYPTALVGSVTGRWTVYTGVIGSRLRGRGVSIRTGPWTCEARRTDGIGAGRHSGLRVGTGRRRRDREDGGPTMGRNRRASDCCGAWRGPIGKASNIWLKGEYSRTASASWTWRSETRKM